MATDTQPTTTPPSFPNLSGDGEIQSAIDAGITSGLLKGAVILATDRAQSFTYTRAIGTRTLLSGETVPQQLDDVLYLASATKLMATIATLQCVDDGLLTLTGDLSAIVPELTGKKVLVGWSDDGEKTPILENPIRPVTLEMLLTHSAGTAYDFLVPELAKWSAKFNPPPVEGMKRPVEEAFAHPLAFQPGEGWMYGVGLDWAGRVVERLTGRSLQQHVQERIVKPVGGVPEDAEFFPVRSEELRRRLVDLNPDDPNATGRQVYGGMGDHNSRGEGCFGGHGLFMTGENYLRVLRSLLVNEGVLLKKETVDDMFQNHLSEGAKKGHEVVLRGPGANFFNVGTNGIKSGYGLGGLVTLEDVDGWYGANTMAWGGGLTMDWFIDRKNDLCGLQALQAKLPVDGNKVAEIKQIFKKDIYRKRASWREAHDSTGSQHAA